MGQQAQGFPVVRVLVVAAVLLAAIAWGRDFIPPTGPAGLLRRLLGHAPLVLVAFLGIPVAVSLARRRRQRSALGVGLACLVLSVGYVLWRIEVRFPRNRLFTPGAYVEAGRLLLGQDLLLGRYEPRTSLVVPNRTVLRARYPVIDVHFHLGNLEGIDAARLVAAFDSVGVAAVVNLDGGPTSFGQLRAKFQSRYPDRFIMFAIPDVGRVGQPGFVPSQLAWLDRAARLGARGLKVWKTLGLLIRDPAGRLVPVDDPQLDPLWEHAADLGFPVLMHVGDPVTFFQPVDRFNERFLELARHPDWSFYGPGFPPADSIWAQRERLVARHPRTVFIAAHLGDQAHDLGAVARMLDRYPNYYVEISSRLNELGRQPRTARAFIVRYQDRILFGTDGGFGLGRGRWTPEALYRRYFEILETENEYVDYPLQDLTRQGEWKVYGLGLPDTVLRKLYYANAARLLADDPAVQRALAQAGEGGSGGAPVGSPAGRRPPAARRGAGGRPVGG